MKNITVGGQLKIQGNIHFGVSGPPTLPQSGAIVAYSLRKLFNSYNGYALRVRRAGDLQTLDIGFTNYNVLDVNSIIAFCGNQTGQVVIWYDQSGNGYNAGPGNSGYGVSFPIIYDGTNIQKTSNDLPAINFNNAYGLVTSNTIPNITFESFFAVEQHPPSVDEKNQRLYSKRRHDLLVSHITPEFVTYYGYRRGTGGVEVNSLLIGGIANIINIIEVTAPTTVTADLRHNGTTSIGSTQTGGALQDNSGFPFSLGVNLFNAPLPGAGNYFTGYISEFIAYNEDQAAYRKQIFDNINYYYKAV